MDIYEDLRFDEHLSRLVALLEAVNRPGGFCTEGRLLVPMPRIVVGETPMLSFPVPDAQARALIATAERAPYGRGQETLYDASVRNCWQVDPRSIRIEGRTWRQTLEQIEAETAAGLGFPPAAITAELYKLLIYERGGFFAPHRDTEKTDRMVATLVVALPTGGNGGDLVVRHHGREQVVAMQTDEPSQLVHAAFYADCEHEIRPVTDGYRIALVYNLIRKEKVQVPANAPDHRDRVAAVAEELGKRCREGDAGRKLVWVLEHDYSEAGLAFDRLKNVDAAVGEVLAAAAERTGCAMFTAILHAEQTDSVMAYGHVYDDDDPDEDDFEVIETDTFGCWLDGLTAPDGAAPDYGKLRIRPGELMPAGRLDLDRPDSQRLFEATGNGGATVDRLYRSAALVIWPREATLQVLAPAGADTILAFLAAERERESAGHPVPVGTRELAGQLGAVWPDPVWVSPADEGWARQTSAGLDLLRSIGSSAATVKFLTEVIAPRYWSALEGAVTAAAAELGGERMRGVVVQLIRSRLADQPAATLELLWELRDLLDESTDPGWRETLRTAVKEACAAVPTIATTTTGEDGRGFRLARKPAPLAPDLLRNLYGLVWQFGLEKDAEAATNFFLAEPGRVAPDRTVPQLLRELHARWPADAAGSPAFTALWRRSTDFLLSRSPSPPKTPSDWTLPVGALRCDCNRCEALRRFGEDPEATEHRIRAAQWDRNHVTDQIDRSGLDLRHRTEKRGRPYTLVVIKTRASHERRLREYQGDIAAMRQLLTTADTAADSGARAAELAAAVALAG